jgi:hypothetical protein
VSGWKQQQWHKPQHCKYLAIDTVPPPIPRQKHSSFCWQLLAARDNATDYGYENISFSCPFTDNPEPYICFRVSRILLGGIESMPMIFSSVDFDR